MKLPKGALVGPYEILATIGEGGMGEVYRARDTRLGREVAIKVLSQVDPSPETRARFEREAKAISQLSHPNICMLYDIGHAGGFDYLVMEYIEGETLADKLERAAVEAQGRASLDIDEVLRMSLEITGALNHAHQRGIIHRDLKPANVMLTKDGVKLLDFGLAKLRKAPSEKTEAKDDFATKSLDRTGVGMIVGTVPYMSPEQLQGDVTDARSDIFSFGAVLYEMLSGRLAFDGRSPASVIAAVIHVDPPPVTTLRPQVPEALDNLVRKCLAKDPDARWQTAKEVLTELQAIADERRLAASGIHIRPSVVAPAPAAPAPPAATGQKRRPRPLIIGGVAVLLAGGALAALLFLSGLLGRSGVKIRHFEVDVKPVERLSSIYEFPAYRPGRTAVTVSPDGASLVFSGRRLDQPESGQKLYLRRLDPDAAAAEAKPLAGSDGGSCPFYSPDGHWIGFFEGGALKKIPDGGGTPVELCKVTGFFGATWTADGSVIFAQDIQDGLWRVSGEGGEPERLTTLDRKRAEVSHRLPSFIPGTRWILFTILRKTVVNWSEAEVAVRSLDSGEVRILEKDGADARFMPPGYVLFVRRGTLMAAPFDKGKVALKGGASEAVRDVMQTINTGHRLSDGGAGQYAVSASGTLAYVTGGITRPQEFALAWRDMKGAAEPLPIEKRAYLMPQISPDGKRALIWTMSLPRMVWIIDLERQVPMRLPVDGNASFPVWGPDGKTVTFMWATDAGFSIARMPVDGTAAPEILTTSDKLIFPMAWSPDGRTFLYQGSKSEIMLLEKEGDAWKSRPWTQPPLVGAAPSFSPDGKWIAYDAYDENTGLTQVYVARFPGPGGRQLISAEPSVHAMWSSTGRELYFTIIAGSEGGTHKFVKVDVTPGDPPVFSNPRVLYEATWGITGPGRAYDLARDAKKILCVLPDQRPYPPPPNKIQVVTAWPEEFKAKLAGK